MHGFSMALAQEVAKKGVTVNTVSPGYIGTDMVMAVPEEVRNKIIAGIPVGRLGKPEEIAGLVTLSGLGSGRFHHWRQPGDQRRPAHDVSGVWRDGVILPSAHACRLHG